MCYCIRIIFEEMDMKNYTLVLSCILLLGACADKEETRVEGSEAGDCIDGADNDLDEKFDCDDEGCANAPDCLDEEVDTGESEDTADAGDTTSVDQDGDGFTTEEGDCDDASANANPDAFDILGDEIDLNCDGVDGIDADGDGVPSIESGGDDCDDTAADVYPAAEDTWYDGIDSNCDGASDYDQDGDGEDAIAHGGSDCDDSDINSSQFNFLFSDLDSDGYGDPANMIASCTPLAGYVDNDWDCDDSNADISPDASEYWGDGLDNNCDGSIDDDASFEGIYAGIFELSMTLSNTIGCSNQPMDCTGSSDFTGVIDPITGNGLLVGQVSCTSVYTGSHCTSNSNIVGDVLFTVFNGGSGFSGDIIFEYQSCTSGGYGSSAPQDITISGSRNTSGFSSSFSSGTLCLAGSAWSNVEGNMEFSKQ